MVLFGSIGFLRVVGPTSVCNIVFVLSLGFLLVAEFVFKDMEPSNKAFVSFWFPFKTKRGFPTPNSKNKKKERNTPLLFSL